MSVHEIRKLLEMAQASLQSGRHEAAAVSYRKILALNPHDAMAHYGLGLALHQGGRPDQAVAAYRAALNIKSDLLGAHCNLGAILHAGGKYKDAIACYSNALKINPGAAQIHYNLGAAWQALGNLDGAGKSYRKALEIKPDYLEAAFNLALVMATQGRPAEAVHYYEKALRINPDVPQIHNGLALALRALGYRRLTLEHLYHAIRLKPDFFEALNNLATELLLHERFNEALEYFQRAGQQRPGDAKVLYNTGLAMKGLKKYPEANDLFRQALALSPDSAKIRAELYQTNQIICDWRDHDTELQRLIEAIECSLASGAECPIEPFHALSLPLSARTNLAIARCHAERVSENAHAAGAPRLSFRKTGSNRIRIGYISPNFNNHAEAHLAAGIFGQHDRSRFEVFAYSIGRDDGSSYRQRIARETEHFIDLAGDSFVDCAARINQDGVQILVDLTGFTTNTRPEILALRPAPVQVSYLGFPGTLGAAFYDYILTDPVVTPPDQQAFYSEAFVYLPYSYQVNDHLQPIPEKFPTRMDCGLPEEAFVFCCFNNSYKLEPSMFDVWMRILVRVPGSVLWLLSGAPEMEAHLRREAGQRGISGNRLVFAGKLPKDQHLARHRHASLFLDTRYYNAHTTASDALRMGVPIVTMPGTSFASRVGASLLKAVDLPQLITASLDEYERLAVHLAMNPSELAVHREKLLATRKRCRLFDTPGFVRYLETAYAAMWKNHESGKKSAQIVIPE